MTCKFGPGWITCTRGPKKKETHKVKNKAGEILEVECTKDDYDIWPGNRSVVCKDGDKLRKFLKSFLEWVE